MNEKMDLCVPCAAKLKEKFNVKKVHENVDVKITCAQCRRRRYGATYGVSEK